MHRTLTSFPTLGPKYAGRAIFIPSSYQKWSMFVGLHKQVPDIAWLPCALFKPWFFPVTVIFCPWLNLQQTLCLERDLWKLILVKKAAFLNVAVQSIYFLAGNSCVFIQETSILLQYTIFIFHVGGLYVHEGKSFEWDWVHIFMEKRQRILHVLITNQMAGFSGYHPLTVVMQNNRREE